MEVEVKSSRIEDRTYIVVYINDIHAKVVEDYDATSPVIDSEYIKDRTEAIQAELDGLSEIELANKLWPQTRLGQRSRRPR